MNFYEIEFYSQCYVLMSGTVSVLAPNHVWLVNFCLEEFSIRSWWSPRSVQLGSRRGSFPGRLCSSTKTQKLNCDLIPTGLQCVDRYLIRKLSPNRRCIGSKRQKKTENYFDLLQQNMFKNYLELTVANSTHYCEKYCLTREFYVSRCVWNICTWIFPKLVYPHTDSHYGTNPNLSNLFWGI